jgi:hypothetical protein
MHLPILPDIGIFPLIAASDEPKMRESDGAQKIE